jgi:alkylation response protein AidB-like acyl-CoA dehydrogenase
MPTDQPDLDTFRARCRAFLDEHAIGFTPATPGASETAATQYLDVGRERLDASRDFLTAAVEAGLGGITYPVEFGGQGLDREYEKVWRDEYSNYPEMTTEHNISLGMCLPMLNEYGTTAQKKAYLPDLISGRKLWCQMFSEPGAGSDVASLQMKAERDGDTWVLNGQKVWTTLAHLGDYGVTIVRTDPDVTKHAGISMFIVPLDAPGVEIRPIHQIDGGRRFNEVFFTDVEVSSDNLLGDLNNGWNMATAMLMYERVQIGTGNSGGIQRQFSNELIAAAKECGLVDDPVIRQRLMHLYTKETCRSLVAMRTRAELKAGRTPGPGGSLGKLLATQIAVLNRDLSMEIIGPSSIAWEEPEGFHWARRCLYSVMLGIAGGTTEIQKNIIGDRVLGLPRDISVDTGVPFNELKVGTQRN